MNIPYSAKETNLIRYLSKKIKNLKYDKIIVEKYKEGQSTGMAWISSSDRESLIEIIRLHNSVCFHL